MAEGLETFTPFPQIEGVGGPGGPASEGREVPIHPSPDWFGAQYGQALERGGEAISRGGEAMLRAGLSQMSLQNQINGDKASAAFTNEVDNIYSNYSKLEGDAAMNAAPSVRKQIMDLQEKYMNAAGGPEAQAYTGHDLRSTGSRYMTYVTNYADRQGRKAQKDAENAKIDSFANSAMTAIANNDVAGAQSLIEQGTQVIKDQSARRQDPPETTGELIAKFKGGIYAQVIKDEIDRGDYK